ncbi:hypothetical protein [Klebsiella pneumoniae]
MQAVNGLSIMSNRATDLLKKLYLFRFQVLLPSTLLVSSRLLTSEYKLRDLDQVLSLLIPFS